MNGLRNFGERNEDLCRTNLRMSFLVVESLQRHLERKL